MGRLLELVGPRLPLHSALHTLAVFQSLTNFGSIGHRHVTGMKEDSRDWSTQQWHNVPGGEGIIWNLSGFNIMSS